MHPTLWSSSLPTIIPYKSREVFSTMEDLNCACLPHPRWYKCRSGPLLSPPHCPPLCVPGDREEQGASARQFSSGPLLHLQLRIRRLLHLKSSQD